MNWKEFFAEEFKILKDPLIFLGIGFLFTLAGLLGLTVVGLEGHYLNLFPLFVLIGEILFFAITVGGISVMLGGYGLWVIRRSRQLFD